ncbi:unnamed protein product, partial [Polarella glacialis]
MQSLLRWSQPAAISAAAFCAHSLAKVDSASRCDGGPLRGKPRGVEVVVRDPAALEQKLRGFHRRNFAVLADFDNTLTQELLGDGTGGKRDGCHKVVVNSPRMPDAFREGMNRLFVSSEKPGLGEAEKDDLFMRLWRESNGLMVSHGLRQEDVGHMVRESSMALRPGAKALLDAAAAADVAVLIFSAGIREVILECFGSSGVALGKARILANGMQFNENGSLESWEEPVVHIRNKSLTLFPEALSHLLEEVRADKVLLIGDQLEDLSMAHGLPIDRAQDIVAVGLLNKADADDRALLQKYMEAFDVVLVGDGPLDFVIELLSRICANVRTVCPSERFFVGLVGGVCSAATESIGLSAPEQRLVHVSALSTSSRLSNRSLYPHFFRTIVPDSYIPIIWLRLVRAIYIQGGGRGASVDVGVVLGQSPVQMTDILTAYAQAVNHDVATGQSKGPWVNIIPVGTLDEAATCGSEGDTTMMIVKNVQLLNLKLVLMPAYAPAVACALCAAEKKGIRATFFVFGWFEDQWWRHTPSTCSASQLERQVLNHIAVAPVRTQHNKTLTCLPGKTSEDVMAMFPGATPELLNLLDTFCALALAFRTVSLTQPEEMTRLLTNKMSSYLALSKALQDIRFIGASDEDFSFAVNSSDPVRGAMLLKQAVKSKTSAGLEYTNIYTLKLPLPTGREADKMFQKVAGMFNVSDSHTYEPETYEENAWIQKYDSKSFFYLTIGLAGLLCGLACFCVCWRSAFLKHVDTCSVFVLQLAEHLAALQHSSEDVFAWALTGTAEDPMLTRMQSTTAPGEHPVRVLVCTDGPEDGSRRLALAVQALCFRERLAPACIRCCVIGSTTLSKDLGSASELSSLQGARALGEDVGGFEASRAMLWSGKKLQRTCGKYVDILPILCDICTYCIVVVNEAVRPISDKCSAHGGAPAKELKGQNSALTYFPSMLGGLACSVLKPEQQNFLYHGHDAAAALSHTLRSPCSSPAASPQVTSQQRWMPCSRNCVPDLVPLTTEAAKKITLARYMFNASTFDWRPVSVDGTCLSGFMLNLWCLALSHGSDAWHQQPGVGTSAWLADAPGELVEMDDITRRAYWLYSHLPSLKCFGKCWGRRPKWEPPRIKLASLLQALFLSTMRRTPINYSPSGLGEMTLDLAEMRRRRRSAYRRDRQQVMQIELEDRRVLCMVHRLDANWSDASQNFTLLPRGPPAPFLVPLSHPCARHLCHNIEKLSWQIAAEDDGDAMSVPTSADTTEPLSWITLAAALRTSNSLQEDSRDTLGLDGHGSGRFLKRQRSAAADGYRKSSVDTPQKLQKLLSHSSSWSQVAHQKSIEEKTACEEAFGDVIRRIQLYLLAFLCKMNSGDDFHEIQRSARQLYAEVVEGFADVVGPVRAQICDKAESRAYQALLKEAAKESNSQPLGTSLPRIGGGTPVNGPLQLAAPALPLGPSGSDAGGDNGIESPANSVQRLSSGGELVAMFRGIATAQLCVEAIAERIAAEISEDLYGSADGSVYVDCDLWAPKSLFQIVQETTCRMVSRGVKSHAGDQLKAIMSSGDRGKLKEAVGQALAQVETELASGFSAQHVKWAVRTTIVCKDFRGMVAVLKRLRQDDQLVIHEVKNRWGPVRWRFPHVLVRASLADSAWANRSEAERHFEVRITHEKIAAVWRGECGGEPDKVSTLRSIFKVLCLGDPENHPSMWCISLGQLKQFAALAKAKLGPTVYARASTTDVVKQLVQPATMAAGRSYACMLNWRELLQVDVFISHAWAENFGNFVTSVEKALENRVRAEETSLWICSFALCQSSNADDIKHQIGKDLSQAPFEKALQRAKEFLVVRNSECDLYSRAWCAYEVFRAHQLGIKIAATGPDSFTKGAVDIMSCS